jgi:CRP-like cAMP-binding protein
MHQKVVTLSRNASLWEEGDVARNVALLQKGKLGARTSAGLVGILWPDMVLGESALFAREGHDERRSASVVALEDETIVAEFSAEQVRDLLLSGDDRITGQVLTTLVGQISRNLLMVVAARRGYAYVEEPLLGLVRGVIEDVRKTPPLRSWDTFMLTARHLYELRDFSDRTLQALGPDAAQRAEMITGATSFLTQLFEGQEVLPALEDFLHAEREKSEWWARGY